MSSSDDGASDDDDGDAYGAAAAKRGLHQTRDEQLYGVFLDGDGRDSDAPPSKRFRAASGGSKQGISFVKKAASDDLPAVRLDSRVEAAEVPPERAERERPTVAPPISLSNAQFRQLMDQSGSRGLGSSPVGLGGGGDDGDGEESSATAPSPAVEKPSWEKHTKGFGMKMLMKMGFKGGGLGKEGKGISRHVEVAVRAGKAAGLGSVKESTALKANKVIQRELQGKAADTESDEEASADRTRRRRRLKSTAEQTAEQGLWRRGADEDTGTSARTRFVTADQLAESGSGTEGSDELRGTKSADIILDMRGPQTRVLSSLRDLPEDDAEGDDVRGGAPPTRLLGQELLHNLNVLVDLTEAKIHDYDKRRKAERERQTALRAEIETLSGRVADGKEQLGRFRRIQAILQDATGPSSGIAARLEIFRTLRSEAFAQEFSMFGMARLAPALVKPAFEAQMREWSPLADPARLVTFLSEWKALLIDPMAMEAQDGSASSVLRERHTVAIHVAMMDDVVIRKIRSCLLSEWDVVNAEPCVRLVEGLILFNEGARALVSTDALRDLLFVLIFPKVKHAIDDWDPRARVAANARIDLWVHPWLPYLSDELTSSYPTIRRKLVSALGACDCSDPVMAARHQELVKPWMAVFDSRSTESMAIQIGGKLALQLRRVDVNPADQRFEVMDSILGWASIFPQTHMSCLLRGEFFPKWHNVLRGWLSSTDSSANQDITEWYRGWKAYLSERVPLDGYLLAEFGHALDLMLSSRKMSPEQFEALHAAAAACSYVALVRASRAQSSESLAASLQHERATKVAGARAAPASFKTVVADFAESKGISFIPKHGRTHDGSQIFSFGGITCYLDDDLVHVETPDRKQWNPVSLEELCGMSGALKGGHHTR
jgi:tuftelin-interacting protein 11